MPTVTESLNTLISNTGTLATTVTGRITDMDGKVTLANTAKTDAETAKGQAETARDTATAQATTATTQAGISTTQAGISTTKASDATTQAGISTTQASTATTQAGTATSQAGIATTQASTATTQAGIATTKASEASTSASNASSAATTAVNAVIDGAPDNLNTLNELAAALSDDNNHATAMTALINARLPLSGGTMTGKLTLPVAGLDLPVNNTYITGAGHSVLQVDATRTYLYGGSAGVQFKNAANTTTLVDITDSGNVTVTGNLNLGDNDRIRLGDSTDLQIWHSGSNSHIVDAGTGILYLGGYGDVRIVDQNTDQTMLNCGSGGAVRAYYAGAMKLETQTGGVGITGTLTASGNVTAYSDERLKDDIQVIPNALSKVEEIRGVTFTRNDLETDERFSGVIAQEVEVVLPEVVHEAEGGMKTVDYGNMVGLLIEGMKEQQEIIRSLATRIEDLEVK